MISSSQRSKIARFFPEMTVDEFINRFAAPDANTNILTLSDCQHISARIAEIAQDLSAEQACEEQLSVEKQRAVDDIIDQIIYSCATKKKFTYTDVSRNNEEYSNVDSTNAVVVTNDQTRKAFASIVVRAMIRNGELEDPLPNQQRAAILRAMWFGLIEAGKRIENWSMSESSKLKRMS